MILFDILQLQGKQFFRSAFFGQGLFVKILLGLFGLYMIVVVTMLSRFLPDLLESASKDQSSYEVLASVLLYYVAFDILTRFFLQKLTAVDLQKFLLTPLKKSAIFHFSLSTSFFNIFNLFGWILLLPFSWRVISPELGTGIGTNWLLAAFTIPLIGNYGAMYLKRIEMVSNFKGIFILLALVLLGFLDYMGWISLLKISGIIFNTLHSWSFSWIGYWMAATILYIINYRLLSKYSHLDDWYENDKSASGIGQFTWLEKKGTSTAILATEIKLILRNKRTKNALWLGFLVLFYPVIFFSNDGFSSQSWSVFVGIFVTGIFMINYGQFMIAWESAGFDGLLTRNISQIQYFQAKFWLLAGSCIIMFLLSTPYIFFYNDFFIPHLACLFFNVGVNSYFLLWASTYNRKRIDLSRGSMMNYQGTGITQFLITIPLMVVPILIVAIPMALGRDNLAWIILISLSLLSLALHKFWMKGIIANFNERKYLTADGFRQKA